MYRCILLSETMLEIFKIQIFALYIKIHEVYEIFLLFQSPNLEDLSRELKVIAAYVEDTFCICSFKPLEQTIYFYLLLMYSFFS